MTCCVALLCDDLKSLILISDRMFGTWGIQSELDINKVQMVNRRWWVLYSGDDISPVPDIIEWTRDKLLAKCAEQSISEDSIPVQLVSDTLKASYERKRLNAAVAAYLTPIGWDLKSFNDEGSQRLPDYLEIKNKIGTFSLGLDFLAGGFSGERGFIFSISPGQQGGVIDSRHDVPGFFSIGSGSPGANYMLWYREVTYRMPTRKALYYGVEAKLFGELGGGVSESTDVFVATADGRFIAIKEDETVEKRLARVWNKLKPRWLKKESIKILNEIPELDGFPTVEEDDN